MHSFEFSPSWVSYVPLNGLPIWCIYSHHSCVTFPRCVFSDVSSISLLWKTCDRKHYIYLVFYSYGAFWQSFLFLCSFWMILFTNLFLLLLLIFSNWNIFLLLIKRHKKESFNCELQLFWSFQITCCRRQVIATITFSCCFIFGGNLTKFSFSISSFILNDSIHDYVLSTASYNPFQTGINACFFLKGKTVKVFTFNCNRSIANCNFGENPQNWLELCSMNNDPI